MGCRLKDILLIGLQDLKVHKKSNIMSYILIFISLLIYIGVNSTIDSMIKNVNDIIYKPEARILILNEEKGQDSVRNVLEEKYKNDDRIESIFADSYTKNLEWNNSLDTVGMANENVDIRFCYDKILDYIVEGEKRIPKEGEIIVPKYLYDIGLYDQYTYADGESLIGQKIKLSYKSESGSFDKDYELVVISAYDNVRMCTDGDLFFTNIALGLELDSLMYKDMSLMYDYIKDTMSEQLQGDELVISNPMITSIYVDEKYDVEEVKNQIYKETGIVTMRHMMINEDLIVYYGSTVFIANIISLLLLIVAVMNIIISSIGEVNKRKWEFALKMSMGYLKTDIIKIYFVEKFINLFRALFGVIIILLGYSFVATYAMQNLLEFWKRAYTIEIKVENIIIALFIIIVSSLIGVVVGAGSIKDIEESKVLKTNE